jgi:hypothetical protein
MSIDFNYHLNDDNQNYYSVILYLWEEYCNFSLQFLYKKYIGIKKAQNLEF